MPALVRDYLEPYRVRRHRKRCNLHRSGPRKWRYLFFQLLQILQFLKVRHYATCWIWSGAMGLWNGSKLRSRKSNWSSRRNMPMPRRLSCRRRIQTVLFNLASPKKTHRKVGFLIQHQSISWPRTSVVSPAGYRWRWSLQRGGSWHGPTRCRYRQPGIPCHSRWSRCGVGRRPS
jgi:hypothetical protein